MSSEENLVCAKCGSPVAPTDTICKKCGAYITDASGTVRETAHPPNETIWGAPVERYKRRYSPVQRIVRVLFSPSDVMEDIALAPDYGGVLGIIVLEIVLAGLMLWIAMQRIHFTGLGTHALAFWNLLTGALTFGLILSIGVYVVFWLVKSWLVKNICNEGSNWDFRTAAAVTGYAYAPILVMNIVSVAVLWLTLPEFTVDMSDLNVAQQAFANFQAQMQWFRWLYTLPIMFLGLLWKSYLGGLGTRSGTKGHCGLVKAFAVFFLLGLVRVTVSFFYQI